MEQPADKVGRGQFGMADLVVNRQLLDFVFTHFWVMGRPELDAFASLSGVVFPPVTRGVVGRCIIDGFHRRAVSVCGPALGLSQLWRRPSLGVQNIPLYGRTKNGLGAECTRMRGRSGHHGGNSW